MFTVNSLKFECLPKMFNFHQVKETQEKKVLNKGQS